MILSCSWISLPCLSSSVIIRGFPRLCVLLTFFKLLDSSIVSQILSKLCFRISSSFAFFFMVLHISTYSMWSLGVLFSIISLRFFIRALVGDDIFGFFCFLVCFAMLTALCWIFEAVDMPCPGPFHFSHSVDYIYEFCPLPNPDVGPSIFVCDVEHTSFHFGLCGRKFVLCLFVQCPGPHWPSFQTAWHFEIYRLS